MKKSVLSLAAALAVFAVQSSAMDAVEDSDGNGAFSMEEMLVAYPELSDETFAEVDTDASGDISEDELAAAVEAGKLGG